LVLNPAEQDQLINRLTRVIEGTAEHFSVWRRPPPADQE
jgi:hypothetical protein